MKLVQVSGQYTPSGMFGLRHSILTTLLLSFSTFFRSHSTTLPSTASSMLLGLNGRVDSRLALTPTVAMATTASQLPRALRGPCDGQQKIKDTSIFTLQLVIPPFDVSHHITSHSTSLDGARTSGSLSPLFSLLGHSPTQNISHHSPSHLY